MIVGSRFPDDSERISLIQHDCYYRALSMIMLAARRRYLSAERVIQEKTELGRRFGEESFDHRTIQWFHDSIAARVRYQHCLEASLFEIRPDAVNEEDCIVEQWLDFLRNEMNRLLKKYDALAVKIGTAAFYPNPDKKGIDAEEYLFELTLSEYPMLDVAYVRNRKV